MELTAQEKAYVTALNLRDALAVAAATLENEYGKSADTVANAVCWQLKAATKELDEVAQTLSEAFDL